MKDIDNYIEELIEETEIPKELSFPFNSTKIYNMRILFKDLKLNHTDRAKYLWFKFHAWSYYKHNKTIKGIAKRNILKILKKYPYN